MGRAAAVVALAAVASGHVLVELHYGGRLPAGDIYGYFLPNVLHAIHAVHHGGRGLLWNPFQCCGEPFFGNAATGLLYPLHWLFLVLEPNRAVHLVQAANMLIGATGMLLYARRLGASPIASLAGALVFELGDPMSEFTRWSPMHCGPWTWVPWAMLACESLLAAPSRRGVVALAVVLALQFLPGFPLIAILTYQLVALRVLWDLVTRPSRPRWDGALAVAAALAAAPLLVAVQLLPMAEFARESLRGDLRAGDIRGMDLMSASQLLAHTAERIPPLPFHVAPLLVAALAPLRAPTRRIAAFFLATGLVYAVLGLGRMTPLFDWYVALPSGAQTLRLAFRLFWLTGFSLAALTALGTDAMAELSASRRRWAVAGLIAVLATALAVAAPGGIRPTEVITLVAVVSAALAGAAPAIPGRAIRWLVLGAIALNLVTVPIAYRGRLLWDLAPLRAQAPLFAGLDPPLTDQDRVLLVPDAAAAVSFQLMQKTSTVLRVPGLFDYEALYGRRFAEYFTTLRRGAGRARLIDVYWPFPVLSAGTRVRLLDAAAVRYVIVSTSLDATANALALPGTAVPSEDVVVHRNDGALPRARFVPRVEVVTDSDALLRRLADGDDDLRRVALVEDAPASGFRGTADPRTGSVRFIVDHPEDVVLDVDAPVRGFLVLADQYYPGWKATVNERPAPVVRANYLFRLVELPAGASRVEFRYRPPAVLIGGIVSALTAAGLVVIAWRRRSRS